VVLLLERSGLQPNGQGRITAHITTSLSFLSTTTTTQQPTTTTTIHTSHLTPSSLTLRKLLFYKLSAIAHYQGRPGPTVCVCLLSPFSIPLTYHTRLLIERERVQPRSSRARPSVHLEPRYACDRAVCWQSHLAAPSSRPSPCRNNP
jgi:hypothetical protein